MKRQHHAPLRAARATRRLLSVGACLSALLLSACQTVPERGKDATTALEPAKPVQAPLPAAVQQALLPPVSSLVPPAPPAPSLRTFDLVIQDAPAREVFMGLAYGTDYNVVLSPKVSGTLTLNLHHITLPDALRAIRAAYGYQYEFQGHQIIIYPPEPETRIYQINYLDISRQAKAQLTVAGTELSPGTNGAYGNNVGAGVGFGQTKPSAEVKTETSADFWKTLGTTLETVVGTEGKVVINPLAGVVVVRAMPAQQREVGEFLHYLTHGLERQVVLEAKILEVQLNRGFQAGINWSAVTGNVTLNQLAPSSTSGSFNPNGYAPTMGNIGQLAPGLLPQTNAVQAFGGAFSAVISGGKGFNALIEALGTQGKVKVLSSPRVATLNNQTAVIKVGTDNIYVTNIQTNYNAFGGVGTTVINQPTPVLSPLFSGVALDVTPAISPEGKVTLYIHPSVTKVSTVQTTFTIGDQNYNLPLASSSVREVDTVVRAESGQVVVIGGLMKTDEEESRSGIPLLDQLPVVGNLFRSTQQTAVKSELVVLLKPVVVENGRVWDEQIAQARKDIREGGMDFRLGVFPYDQTAPHGGH